MTGTVVQYQTRVYCTLQFEGFHFWPDAPKGLDFLRQLHRHMFHVRAEAEVTGLDREIEFITLKGRVQGAIKEIKNSVNVSTWSCEQWAVGILTRLPFLVSVEVSEDGENGAVVFSRR